MAACSPCCYFEGHGYLDLGESGLFAQLVPGLNQTYSLEEQDCFANSTGAVTGDATTLVLQISCDCLSITQGIVNYSGVLQLPGLLKQIKQLVSFALRVSSMKAKSLLLMRFSPCIQTLVKIHQDILHALFHLLLANV
jgi:hypothetical protein